MTLIIVGIIMMLAGIASIVMSLKKKSWKMLCLGCFLVVYSLIVILCGQGHKPIEDGSSKIQEGLNKLQEQVEAFKFGY